MLFGNIKRLAFLTGSLLLVAPCADAVVIFAEGFESPSLPSGTDSDQPSGTYTYDNPNWVVSAAGPFFGVYLNNGNVPFVGSTSQELGFGGGNNPGPNEVSTVINGFTGMSGLAISFEALSTVNANQGLLVEVTDPNNFGALLYSSGNIFGGATISSASFTGAPVGDSVELTVSQVGNTNSSDTAIDDIEITAVPEPSALLLIGLGGVAMMRRRRKL